MRESIVDLLTREHMASTPICCLCNLFPLPNAAAISGSVSWYCSLTLPLSLYVAYRSFFCPPVWCSCGSQRPPLAAVIFPTPTLATLTFLLWLLGSARDPVDHDIRHAGAMPTADVMILSENDRNRRSARVREKDKELTVERKSLWWELVETSFLFAFASGA